MSNKINDNDNYEEQLKVKISQDIEGIEFPEFYFNIIEELFFQNYYNKEICSVKVCKRLYRVIQCDSSKGQFGIKDIKSFPKITFNIIIIIENIIIFSFD